jgi:hypothetical protein
VMAPAPIDRTAQPHSGGARGSYRTSELGCPILVVIIPLLGPFPRLGLVPP